MSEYAILDPMSHLADGTGTGLDSVDLVETLDLEELRGRVWALDPGEALNYHRQTRQEELYVVLDGPAEIHVGGDDHEIPEGGLVRVPPGTVRQVRNDSEDRREVWLILGAPPVPGDGEPLDQPTG